MKAFIPKINDHPFIELNRNAVNFYYTSQNDYIAARCLIKNLLLYAGLVLAQQAIEKMMKATILFKNPKYPIRKLNHGVIDLAKILEADFSYKLNDHEDLLKRLEKHYNSRYPDNPNQSTSRFSGEITEVDQLFFYLLENLEIPDFLKYRNLIFGYLFEDQNQFMSPKRYIQDGNYVLNLNSEKYKRLYNKTKPENSVIEWIEVDSPD